MPHDYLHRRLLRRGHGLLESDLVPPELRERVRGLDRSLRDLALGDGAPRGFDPNHFIGPGLPRVRPVLVLLSERAARGGGAGDDDGDEVTEHVAAAVELVHLAISVHDAALGKQGGRRRRAARRLLGGAVGWLGGNHMTLRALELARHAPGPELMGDLLEALREVSEGHALSQAVRDQVASTEQCLAIADGHSGAVFSFACRAGARIAGAERPVVTGLGRYGRHAGMAWHLAEDIAVLSSQGNDEIAAEDAATLLVDWAASGRPVYPVSLAAERDPHIRALWLRLAEDEDSTPTALLHAVQASGALAPARERLVWESWNARKALNRLPPSTEREALDRIAARLTA